MIICHVRKDTIVNYIDFDVSRKFVISTEKTPKESSKNKEPNDLTDDDYDVTQLTLFSQEWDKAIREWFNLVGKNGVIKLIDDE